MISFKPNKPGSNLNSKISINVVGKYYDSIF